MRRNHLVALLAAALALAATPALAQQGGGDTGGVPHIARGNAPAGAAQAPDLRGHPLQPAMNMAWHSRQSSGWMRDYSATLVKREWIEGHLTPAESMFIKIRRQPFSIYVYCLGPDKPQGQEAIYVEGQNDNLVLAHTTGVRHRLAGTLRLEPTHERMMEGNRNPLTMAGIDNLLQRMIDRCQYEAQFGECEVQVIPDAKVDGRACDVVQVLHPVQRANFRFYLTRTYFDRELNLPIRWEAYDWPTQAGGAPQLVEEYTYRNLKCNVGLTDADFDPSNPAYGFE